MIIDNINCKIYHRKQQIYLDDYMKEINQKIEDIIINKKEETKPSLLLSLEKQRSEFFIIFITGLIKFYENLRKNNDIMNHIDVGDIVIYNKKKYIYDGKKIINDREMLVLKAKETKQAGHKCASIDFIDKSKSKDIAKYYGESDKLGKIRDTTNTLNTYIEKLKKIFINSDELNNGVIDEQIVVVFESKQHINLLLSLYFIEIEGHKYKFDEIFPCKYYTDEDRYVDLNNDITKGLFIFTSKIEVANDILLNNKQCKTVILLGEKTYENRLETTLSRMFKRLEKKKLNDIIIHNDYNKINIIKELLDKNIDCYAWSKQVIKNKYEHDNNYINAYNIIHIYFKYSIKNELIDNKEINGLIQSLNNNLINILRNKEEIIDSKIFLICAYKMFNKLQDYVYPIKIYEEIEILEPSKNNEVIFKNILEKNEEYQSNYDLLSIVIKQLMELHNILYDKNPKIRRLKKISDNNSIIVCKDEMEKNLLKTDNKLEYKKIITKDDIANYNENETFIFVSKYRRTNEFQYSYIRKNNVVNILNNVQANKYNSKARFTNKLLDIIESNNRLSSEDRKATKDEYMPIINLKEKILLEKVEVNDEENNDILETYVEKELHDFDYIKEIKKLTNIKLNKFNTSQESMYSGTVTVTRKIYYSEDGYSYITDNSKIVMLDDNNKIKGFINNAKISDRILFIDEKTENDLNILFDKIVESKIFKEKYKQHYQNMIYWKKVLRKYIDDYNLNYNDIANELIIHEISKTPQTIRGWLKSESIIGPWEEKFYKALGEITFDQKLISNWKEIFESNNTIREFRRQFRNTFKNMIQHAVCNTISEENELEILVNRVFGNLKEYAKILKIVDIDEISLEIPYAQTNCLIYDK